MDRTGETGRHGGVHQALARHAPEAREGGRLNDEFEMTLPAGARASVSGMPGRDVPNFEDGGRQGGFEPLAQGVSDGAHYFAPRRLSCQFLNCPGRAAYLCVMPAAFQYRPRFVDIRVKPPRPEEGAGEPFPGPESGERVCDHADCRAVAVIRAPKSREALAEHYWFCRAHAAEYNRGWNFFAGMSEGEIRARVAEEQATGGRPTWSFKPGPRMREAAIGRGAFRDAFGLFAAEKSKAAAAAGARRLGRLELAALADLDLDVDASGAAIRLRYIELVKRCHPDANGGDRSAEHKLQRVLKAYKTLRKARLA